MTLSIIRRYTKEDQARVKSTAERFCQRHAIAFEGSDITAEVAIDYWVYSSHPEDKAYRRKIWAVCYCRALGMPTSVRITTGYGYIGTQEPHA